MFFNPYASPLILAAAFGFIVAGLCLQYGNAKGERYFAFSMIFSGLYAAFYTLELSSSQLSALKLFLVLQYTGAPFIIPFLLLFVLKYSGHKEYISKKNILIIFFIPVITALLVFTNPLHHQFYTWFEISNNGYFPILQTGKGVGYYIHQFYSICLTLLCDIILIILLFSIQRIFFIRVFLIVIGISIAWLTYLLHVLVGPPYGIDLVPFSFIISGLIFYIGLIRWKIFNIIPAAFETVFKNLNEGLLVIDNEGFVINSNRHAKIMLGLYSKSGQLRFADITGDWPGLQDAFEKKNNMPVIEKQILNEKDKNWYEVSMQPLREESDRVVGKVISIRNINKRKQSEEEMKLLMNLTQKQNDRLKNFAHIVSHNLRSHAANIKSLSDLLTETRPDLVDSEIVALLKNSSENMMNTISDLSEVAMLNTNEQNELENIELNKVVKKAIGHVSGIAKDARVNIFNHLNDAFYVLGIPEYLDSIVLNLLTNAIKYRKEMEGSMVKVTGEQNKNYVKLSVEDNGIGIDLARHGAKIFGLYKTFHKHPDARGVGLFITKNQIEAIGGRIEVESKLGEGTVFNIFFNYEKS